MGSVQAGPIYFCDIEVTTERLSGGFHIVTDIRSGG